MGPVGLTPLLYQGSYTSIEYNKAIEREHK